MPIIVILVTAHGTFIGSIRLEHKKPQQVPLDSDIHFGHSTRHYIIRERPQTSMPVMGGDLTDKTDELEGGFLGLPESETELDVSEVFFFSCIFTINIFLCDTYIHMVVPLSNILQLFI